MEAPMVREKTRERENGYSTSGRCGKSGRVETESSVGAEERSAERFLAIAIAHDGVAHSSNGQDRERFQDLIDVLLQSDAIPATLCFYTEGVRWLTRESPVLGELLEIRRRGAEIVACRSCLAEAGLLDAVAVGRLDSQDHIDDILRHARHTMVL